jgi:uncharacterized membrane protein
MNEKASEQIEAVFRNGSVTVVGVIVGFSLTFLTSWASAPTPWQIHDLLGLVPLVIGVVLQLFALSALLHTDSLERPIYERAVRLFLIGLVLICIGLVGVITIDAFTVARRG